MADTDTQYRIVRNLKHNGSQFEPGQVVAGFDADTAARLLESGTIAEITNDQPVEVLSVDAKKPRSTTAPAADPQTPAAPTATVVGQPQAPATPQAPVAPPEPVVAPVAPQAPQAPTPGGDGGENLTPEQQAVRDAANQVN